MNRKGFMVLEILLVVLAMTAVGWFFSANQGSDQNQQVVCEDNVGGR